MTQPPDDPDGPRRALGPPGSTERMVDEVRRAFGRGFGGSSDAQALRAAREGATEALDEILRQSDEAAEDRRIAREDREQAAADRATASRRFGRQVGLTAAGIVASTTIGIIGLVHTLSQDDAPVPPPVVTVVPAPAPPAIPR